MDVSLRGDAAADHMLLIWVLTCCGRYGGPHFQLNLMETSGCFGVKCHMRQAQLAARKCRSSGPLLLLFSRSFSLLVP